MEVCARVNPNITMKAPERGRSRNNINSSPLISRRSSCAGWQHCRMVTLERPDSSMRWLGQEKPSDWQDTNSFRLSISPLKILMEYEKNYLLSGKPFVSRTMLPGKPSLLKQRFSGKKYASYRSFQFLNAWEHTLMTNENYWENCIDDVVSSQPHNKISLLYTQVTSSTDNSNLYQRFVAVAIFQSSPISQKLLHVSWISTLMSTAPMR